MRKIPFAGIELTSQRVRGYMVPLSYRGDRPHDTFIRMALEYRTEPCDDVRVPYTVPCYDVSRTLRIACSEGAQNSYISSVDGKLT